MNGKIIAQTNRDLPLRRYASFQTVKQMTIATFCEMKKQSLHDNLVNGVHCYGFAIRGKGSMTGKLFADECRKVWTEDNVVNARYYAMFENHIDEIEYRVNGHISVRYKNMA